MTSRDNSQLLAHSGHQPLRLGALARGGLDLVQPLPDGQRRMQRLHQLVQTVRQYEGAAVDELLRPCVAVGDSTGEERLRHRQHLVRFVGHAQKLMDALKALDPKTPVRSSGAWPDPTNCAQCRNSRDSESAAFWCASHRCPARRR